MTTDVESARANFMVSRIGRGHWQVSTREGSHGWACIAIGGVRVPLTNGAKFTITGESTVEVTWDRRGVAGDRLPVFEVSE